LVTCSWHPSQQAKSKKAVFGFVILQGLAQILDLIIEKDRSVLATVKVLKLASAAFTHSTLHMPLKGHHDSVFGDMLCEEFLYHEMIHHRRPDNNRHCSFRLDINPRDECGYDADIPRPVRRCPIDCAGEMHIRTLYPSLHVVFEQHILRGLASEEQVHFPEVPTVIDDIIDQ
jgi:hypothetical protein